MLINKEIINAFSDPFNSEKAVCEQTAATRSKFYGYDTAFLDKRLKDGEDSGKFVMAVNGVKFSGLFIKGSSKSLTVIYDGARQKGNDYLKNPLVPRWSYYNLLDGCLLGISDPMFLKYPDLDIGWYYGDDKQSYISLSLGIVEYFCAKHNIPHSQVCFFSSSGGGYAALIASSLWRDSLSVSINPQIYIQNYGSANLFKQITGYDLQAKDNLHRNAMHELLKRSQSRHVIIVNAQSSSDYNDHLLPLAQKFGWKLRYGLNQYNNFLVWIYDTVWAESNHTAFETKAIFWQIADIANRFKNDPNFDISQYQERVVLINELWELIYKHRNKIYQLECAPPRNSYS